MNLLVRAVEAERLDAPEHEHTALQLTLSHLEGVNRWLGGARVVLKHVAAVTREKRVWRILDVGTGSADIPRRIVEWADTHEKKIIIWAVDRQRQVARVAAARSARISALSIGVADGVCLPLPARSVDVAIASATLHHFTDSHATQLLAELARVASCAVIVNDLERHPLNLMGAAVLARTVWRRSPYRFDGPLSVRRSFVSHELLAIADAAGLKQARVYRHFPFRLALVGSP